MWIRPFDGNDYENNNYYHPANLIRLILELPAVSRYPGHEDMLKKLT